MKVLVRDLQKGDFVNYEGKVYQVVDTDFNYRGRGSALVSLKLKDLENSSTTSKTFKSDFQIQLKDLVVKRLEFLFMQDQTAFFMDPEDYLQYEALESVVEEIKPFLKQGESYLCYLDGEKILKVALPKRLSVKVVEAQQAIKGDRVSAGKKPVIIEGGITILVPLFVKKGDQIIINPETKEYIERQK